MELLFETRLEIARIEGKVYFFQAQPALHPEPVLRPDGLVDGAAAYIYGSVLRDGGRYRMWYQACPKDWAGRDVNLVAYAESDDGINWIKPTLRLVPYGDDGGANNLCDLGFHSPSVFIDPRAPAGHRYRATGFSMPGRLGGSKQIGQRGYYTAHSADGLHWELDRDTPQWHSGDVITSIYHPSQERAIVALKFTPRANGFPRRSIWNAELREGAWSEAHAALVPDEYADIAAGARGYASADYYGMGMMPAGQGTVGFLWQFRHSLPRTSGTETGVFGTTDVSLVYQAARGDCWLHVPGRKDFIAHDQLAWTSGGIYTASGAVEAGDEQRLYFGGTTFSHAWYLDNRWQLIERRRREMIDVGFARIGYAHWPTDRLFGFRSDPEGVLELDLGVAKGACELWLNFKTTASGSVRVELPDVPGYALSDAVPLAGDCLARAVAWKSGSVIILPAGDRLKARLHLDCAEVFAYEVRPVA